MAKKKSPGIDEIIAKKLLVHFNRKPLDKHLLYGFVIAGNDEFTLLNIFDAGLFMLDGYCVFLNKDVKNYATYENKDYFLSEVIRHQKIIPKPTKIDISSWREIVQTVSEGHQFFVVETERLHKNECYVGTLKSMKKKSFVLREIDPDACWSYETNYKFNDLTMIKFGGRYETTLALVNSEREKNSK